MFSRFLGMLPFNFFKTKKPVNVISPLYLFKTSYDSKDHSTLHEEINVQDIKTNGFLVSNEEKEKLLLYMAYHEGPAQEEISSDSPLNQTPGKVLIDRKNHLIYKFYQPKDGNNEGNAELVIGDGSGKISLCQNLITGQICLAKRINKNLLDKFDYLFYSVGINKTYPLSEIKFCKQEKLFVDYIETSGQFYIIQKKIEGIDVFDLAVNILHFNTPQNENKLYQLFFTVLKKMTNALADFHSRNSVHRDISLENFIYNPKEDKIYLIDFSVAIKLALGQKNIFTGAEFVSKIHSFAPEAWIGVYGYASDIYALGISFARIKAKFFPDSQSKIINHTQTLITEMTARHPDKRPTFDYILQKINDIEKIILEELAEGKNKNSNAKDSGINESKILSGPKLRKVKYIQKIFDGTFNTEINGSLTTNSNCFFTNPNNRYYPGNVSGEKNSFPVCIPKQF